MVERHLGMRLEKMHSAVDWSIRPLHRDWLAYAALDVELLVDLRTALADELDRAGKSDWAAQEFEAVRVSGPPPQMHEMCGPHSLGHQHGSVTTAQRSLAA